jgi:hypothetical protein
LQGVKAAARGADNNVKSAAELQGINAAAKGIDDLAVESNAADEKAVSRTADLQDNATKKVRGEGK